MAVKNSSLEEEMRCKRLIPPGTTILKEKPFVYVLSSKNRTEYCDACFKKGKLLKCSGCQYVYYCGKMCQRDAWSIHKMECRSLRRVAPRVVPDSARLLARLIFILRKGGDQVKSFYTEGSFRMFKDLMSHYPDLKNDKSRMEHFTSLCGVLFDFLGETSLPNSAELIGLYGRMCINSFNICEQELQSLGAGIYLGASVIDHSCDPSAVAIFEGTTLCIRNIKPLQGLDFSQVFISYIETLNTPKQRQEELESLYYFTCKCTKCLDPKPLEVMFAAVCPNAPCTGYVNMANTDALTCSKCNTSISDEFLQQYKEITEFSEMHLQSMKQTAYLDVCQICLKKQENVLHKLNIYHVKILDMAFESSIEFSQWEEAKKYGTDLIEGYTVYYGESNPLFGLLYLKMGKLLLYLDDDAQALEYLQKAREILKITHGTSSTIFKQLMPLLQQANGGYSLK